MTLPLRLDWTLGYADGFAGRELKAEYEMSSGSPRHREGHPEYRAGYGVGSEARSREEDELRQRLARQAASAGIGGGCQLELVIAVAVFLWLFIGSPHYSEIGALALAVVAFTFATKVHGAVRKDQVRVEMRRVALAPCAHGTEGGAQRPWTCNPCTTDRAARALQAKAAAEEQRRRLEEQQRQRAAEAQQRQSDWRKRVRLPEYLKTMDPEAFEHLVCDLYQRLGYEVRSTPYVGDSGVDGFLQKGGRTFILQCKRVKGSVGEPVLRDLYGTMVHERAAGAVVVTTGSVSMQARTWAQGKPIELVELDQLRRLIDQVYDERAVVPDSFTVEATPRDDVCPLCGAPLHVVKGRHGSFLGCIRYPKCTYTRNLGKRRRHRRRR